jgi:hypothetical protein
MSELPKTINVTRVISYDVAKVVENILEDRTSSTWVDGKGNSGGQPETLEVTIEDVMERIESYCEDDFSCGWGHKNEIDDLIFTDQDGNEI